MCQFSFDTKTANIYISALMASVPRALPQVPPGTRVPAEAPPGPASQAEVAPGTMPPPAPPPPPQLSSFGIDMVDFGIDPRTTQSRYPNNSQPPRSPAPRVLFRLPRQVVLQMQQTINNIDREE